LAENHSLTASPKHDRHRRQASPRREESASQQEGCFPIHKDRTLIPKHLLRPAHLQKMQNALGNRAVVQALRFNSPGQQPSSDVVQCQEEEESSWLDTATDWVSDTAGSAWDTATDVASQGMDWAQSAAGEAGDVASSAWDAVSDVGQQVWDATTDVAGQGIDLASEGARYLWETGSQGLENLWASGVSGAEAVWEMIKNGAEGSGLGKPFGLDSGVQGIPPTGLMDPSSWEGLPGSEGTAEMNANTPSTYRMNVLPMTTYKITGDTIADVGQELDARQSMWGEAGHVSRTPSIDTVTYETTGKIARVDYVNDVQKQMPEWTKKDEVGKTAPKWLAEWNRFYKALDAHEEGHLNLYKANFGTGKVTLAELAKFKDKTETEADAVEAEIAASREQAQADYDSRTSHGLPDTEFRAGTPPN